jgi:WD40 repeat protein
MSEPTRPSLSADDPWPGLASFDEADSSYFRGRAGEAAELLRLVRREALTVLFGRSGLGKTSLLKAGLFPALRQEDMLPVYVRLDHGATAPPLREQVLLALQDEAAARRVQTVQPAENETLWSFFHRREVEFWSDRSRPVTPVIVFDQFEEVFTQDQQNDTSRSGAAAFIAELTDLVESRPPPAVKAAIEGDPALAGRYEFRRATVKLVLSFREDFLAEMEGLRTAMPSMMVNRQRLLPMNGAQAYKVVAEAGAALVDDELARRILRLAWKNEPEPAVDSAEFEQIEIDPALLSVVCSELNRKRRESQPPLPRITSDLLAGADREILNGFYERSMAGLDGRVRAFVEEQLITAGGYRDSRDWDDALARPGVTQQALDDLISRRLLSAEERQGRRRIELRHDVLTRVVMGSRDQRRAREATERAEADKARAEQETAHALAMAAVNRRRSRIAIAGALAALVFALVATALGFQARRALDRANALTITAQAGELAATAEGLGNDFPDESLLLALEARRMDPVPLAIALLRAAEAAYPYRVALRGHEGQVFSAQFSADGKTVLTASSDKTARLWDVASGQELRVLRGHEDRVTSAQFSADGKTVVTASLDKTARLWDVASGQELRVLRGHEGAINSAQFSADGKTVLTASSDRTARLWDVVSGQELQVLRGHEGRHEGWVYSAQLSADGKTVLTASSHGTARLWDVASGQELRALRGHRGAVHSAQFSTDGKKVLTAGADKTARLWDVASGQELQVLRGHEDRVTSAQFSADGKAVLTASWDKTARLWDVASGQELRVLRGHAGRVYSAQFSADGRTVVTASSDKTARLWDVASSQELRALRGHEGPVNSAQFSADGHTVATASWDRTARLWDVASSQELRALRGHEGPVNSAQFSADGHTVVTASWDRTARLWDVASGQELRALRGHEDAVTSAQFSADGKTVVTASSDKTARLWDVASGKELRVLRGHEEWVSSAQFSADGKTVLTASRDETARLWEVASGQELRVLRGHVDAVTSAQFSADGKTVVTASSDRTSRLWDVASGKELRVLRGHVDAVTSAQFSADGKTVVTASSDKTARLWDVASGKELRVLRGHEDAVNSAQFSADGKTLLTASNDKTARLWECAECRPVQELVVEIARKVGRELTEDERRRFGLPLAQSTPR